MEIYPNLSKGYLKKILIQTRNITRVDFVNYKLYNRIENNLMRFRSG